MNVIDIASYQGSLNLGNIAYDGVAIKATEGNGYVNPYCDTHYQQAKSQGKKRAVYHFYDFSIDAVVQADYFVDQTIGYQHDSIFVLDWEGAGVGDVAAALRFLQRVEARIGYKPAIYMSEWVENHYDWSAVVNGNYGLWLAKYADYEIDNNYDTSNAGKAPVCVHWPFYFMWQWTSKGRLNGYAGDLDCDIFYGDAATWDAYAGINKPTPTTTTTTAAPAPPEPTTTTTTVAQTTTTTTVGPEPTTTTTIIQSPSTTTTTTAPSGDAGTTPENPSWITIIVAVFIAIINHLRGVK